MTPLIVVLMTASAQSNDAPNASTLLAEMAPYRRQLADTLRTGEWRTAPSAGAEDAFCLEQLLMPTPGGPRDGSTLAVAEGIALADYIIDQTPYTPRYMRTHYKQSGNLLAVWEGSERQYTQRMIGEYWHDAVWAGRDTLLVRDDEGRVQTVYMEATLHANHCTCEIPGHDNLCPPFMDLDSRSSEMAAKGAFYALVQLVWEGDVVTGARISEVYFPTTGALRLMAYEPERGVEAVVEMVSMSEGTGSPGSCSSPTDSPLALLSLSWHASKAATR